MANLSKIKRQRMLDFLETIKKEHTDDDSIRAITEIENHLLEKKYGLVWEEHSEYIDEMLDENIPIFIEDSEKQISNSEKGMFNYIIEGDNLQSLYLLEKTHKGLIDVIYIDPPYNTGKEDFVYSDKAVDSNDSFRHSKWLSFMYKRLKIAKNLLSDEGVIFISIDDNEQAQLKLLCDDLFDETNFLAQIVWERAYSPVNLKKHFSKSHDYILCYAKNSSVAVCNGSPRAEDANNRYSNPDNDPRGPWKPSDLSVGPVVEDKLYPITTPSGRVVTPPKGRCWSLSQDSFNEKLRDNRIWFGPEGKNVPAVKRFLSELRKSGVTPMTIWKYQEVGHSQEAAQKLKDLFGGEALFDYPKPVGLIKKCIQLYSKPNSIILDFFAGSGTTGQAVLEANAEDGGNRRFIICTNNELSEKKEIEYFVKKGCITNPPRKGTKMEEDWKETWGLFKNSKQYDEEIQSDEFQALGICRCVTYPRLNTVITGVRRNGTTYSDGCKANLKYFRCGWTPRVPKDYYLSDVLCLHIKEMIELKTGEDIDNVHNILILNKDDFHLYIRDNPEIYKIEKIWVNQNIIFSLEESKLLEHFQEDCIRYIPKEFFGVELKAVAE